MKKSESGEIQVKSEDSFLQQKISSEVKAPILRMVAWEVTRSCNLNCCHCRAAAERGPYPEELSTDESLKLIDDIAAFSQPVIILTGGEPLLREGKSDV